jgi:hypothetical protein
MTGAGRSARWLVAAGVLTLARLLGPLVPVSFSDGVTYDLGQAHAVCSFFGQAGAGVATDCGRVALGYDALNVIAVAAVACAVLFIAHITTGRGSQDV